MIFQNILFKSVLWRGLFYISQLLLNILIARYYEPEGSGWIFYNLNNYAFVLLILSLCVDSGMGYYSARNELTEEKLFSLSIVWTSAVVLLSILFLWNYPYKPTTHQTLFYLSSLAFIGGSTLITFFSALFFAKKNFHLPNVVLLSVNVLVVLLFIFMRVGNGLLNKDEFLYVYVGSFFLQGLLLLFLYKKDYVKAALFTFPQRSEMKLLLRYSLLAFTGNILTFLVFRCDYWFIDYFDRPAAELGNYIQVSKIVQLFFAIPGFLASAIFPLSAADNKNLVDNLKVLSRILFFSFGLVCLFLALTGRWLFPFVFGANFSQMYLPFLFLIPGTLSICLAYPLAAYFSGKHNLRTNIRSSLIALIIIIIGNIIFIPIYGIYAAAAVSSAGYVSLFIFLLYHFRRQNRSTLKEYLLFKKEDWYWIKSKKITVTEDD